MKVIDATVLFEEPFRLHGIARVEVEILRCLKNEPNVKFVNLSADFGPSFVSFETLSTRLNQIFAEPRTLASRGAPAAPSSSLLPKSRKLAQMLISKTPKSLRLLITLPLGVLVHLYKAIMRLKKSLYVTTGEFRQFVKAERRFVLSQIRQPMRRQNLFHHLNPSVGTNSLGVLQGLSDEDSFFSAGLLFKRIDMALLARLKRQKGLKLIILIHDLVPVIYPHLTFQHHGEKYLKYFSDALHIADTVVSYSDTTSSDIQNYAKQVLFIDNIDIQRVELGFDHLVPEAKCGSPISLLDGERFVIYVSTVERRKNHDVLYRAYELAAAKGIAERLPRLVIVGSEGWGASSVINDLRLDPILTDKNGRRTVMFLEDASDEQLVWLYQNAHFSVYPSLYEGWGLPVTESLLNGTTVIVSDRGSLMEASFGQAKALPAKDAEAWAKTIIEYAESDKKRVEKPHHVKTWEAMGRRISSLMEG